MEQLEEWLVVFFKSPQCIWIMLLLVGFIVVEITLHHKDKAYREIAQGISTCFSVYCMYILNALLFGPMHHSFLEDFQLSSCLPFLSERLIRGDWAIFCFFNFPKNINEISYELLKMLIIFTLFDTVTEYIENNIKEKGNQIAVWAGVQAGIVLLFTFLLSTVNFLIERLIHYQPVFGTLFNFLRKYAVFVLALVVVLLIVAVFSKRVVSSLEGKDGVEVPGIFNMLNTMFFKTVPGISVFKSVVTTYFSVLVYKLISMTYIKTVVFNNVGHMLFVIIVLMVFLWYSIRRGLNYNG